jgi:hypothetical protein
MTFAQVGGGCFNTVAALVSAGGWVCVGNMAAAPTFVAGVEGCWLDVSALLRLARPGCVLFVNDDIRAGGGGLLQHHRCSCQRGWMGVCWYHR